MSAVLILLHFITFYIDVKQLQMVRLLLFTNYNIQDAIIQ